MGSIDMIFCEKSIKILLPSGKAEVCKTSMPQFKSGWRLQKKEHCVAMLFFSTK